MLNRAFLCVILVVFVSGVCATAQDQEQPPQRSTSSTGEQYYRELFHPFGAPGGDSSGDSTSMWTSDRGDPAFRLLTRDEAEALLRKYIEKRSKNPQKLFPIEDESSGKEMRLRPVNWMARLIPVSRGRAAMRADFLAEDGTQVTVDFVVKRSLWWGTWGVSDPAIYGVGGVPVERKSLSRKEKPD